MEIIKPKATLILKLNEEEIKYLMKLTQKSSDEETPKEHLIRKDFYKVTSEALGYNGTRK